MPSGWYVLEAYVWVDVLNRRLVNQDLRFRVSHPSATQDAEGATPVAPNVAGALGGNGGEQRDRTTDVCCGLQIVSETGDTFSDVPTMMSRSTSCLSSISERSNTSSSFSPKKVISG